MRHLMLLGLYAAASGGPTFSSSPSESPTRLLAPTMTVVLSPLFPTQSPSPSQTTTLSLSASANLAPSMLPVSSQPQAQESSLPSSQSSGPLPSATPTTSSSGGSGCSKRAEGCLLPVTQLGSPMTSSGTAISLPGGATPITAVSAWGLIWTPLAVLLPGYPSQGERVEVTCLPQGHTASGVFFVAPSASSFSQAGVVPCSTLPTPSGGGGACLAVQGSGLGSGALSLNFVVSATAPASSTSLLNPSGFPPSPQWTQGRDGIVCTVVSTMPTSTSTSGGTAPLLPRYPSSATLAGVITAVSLPVVWSVLSGVLVEVAGAPGSFKGVGGVGAGGVFSAPSTTPTSLTCPTWSNATLVTSPQCSSSLAALFSSVIAPALTSPLTPQPILSLSPTGLTTLLLLSPPGVNTAPLCGAFLGNGGGGGAPSALPPSTTTPSFTSSAVNWVAPFNTSSNSVVGGLGSLLVSSVTLPSPSTWCNSGTGECSSVPLGVYGGVSSSSSSSSISQSGGVCGGGPLTPLGLTNLVGGVSVTPPSLLPTLLLTTPPLPLPFILPIAPLLPNWPGAINAWLSSPTSQATLNTSAYSLPPTSPIYPLTLTMGASSDTLALLTLSQPSSGVHSVTECTNPGFTPLSSCSLPWGSAMAPPLSPPSGCPSGSGATCINCPTGAACPGGTRLLPLPGYRIPWEDSPAVLLTPCSPPDASNRCPGWYTIGYGGGGGGGGGGFPCSAGFMGKGCGVCVPGMTYPSGSGGGGGECLPCGSSVTAWTAGNSSAFMLLSQPYALWVGGVVALYLVFAGVAALRLYLSPLAPAGVGYPPIPFLTSLLQALTTLLTSLGWLWVQCQTLVTTATVTHSFIPQPLAIYLSALLLVQFRGAWSVHSWCGNSALTTPSFDQLFWVSIGVAAFATLLFIYHQATTILHPLKCLALPPQDHARVLTFATSLLLGLYAAISNTIVAPLSCSSSAPMALSDYLALPGADGSSLTPAITAAVTSAVAAAASPPILPLATIMGVLNRVSRDTSYAYATGLAPLLRQAITVQTLTINPGVVCFESEHKAVYVAAWVGVGVYTAGLPVFLLFALWMSGRIPPLSQWYPGILWLVFLGEGEEVAGKGDSGTAAAAAPPLPRTPSIWDPCVKALSDLDCPPKSGWWLRPMDLLVQGGLAITPTLLSRGTPLPLFAGLTALAGGAPLLQAFCLWRCKPYGPLDVPLKWGEIPSGSKTWKYMVKVGWLLLATALAIVNFFLFNTSKVSTITAGPGFQGLGYASLGVGALAFLLPLYFCTLALGVTPPPPPPMEVPAEEGPGDFINGGDEEGEGGEGGEEEGGEEEEEERVAMAPKMISLTVNVHPNQRFASASPPAWNLGERAEGGLPGLRRLSPLEIVPSLRSSGPLSPFQLSSRRADNARMVAQSELLASPLFLRNRGDTRIVNPLTAIKMGGNLSPPRSDLLR